jgi:hypothetical protein
VLASRPVALATKVLAGGSHATTSAIELAEQLARVIGKDERTIRRWEQTRLAPALSVGPDGVHRFDVQRVRELIEIRERRAPATPGAYDAETAAEVFTLFAEGIDPVDVVGMKIHPLAVDALRRQWAALRGGFAVSTEIARRISSLRGCPILDADGLLKALLEPRPNTQCTESHGEFIDGEALCASCSRRLSVEQAHRREAQAGVERARREQRKAEQKAERLLALRTRPMRTPR